MNCFSQFLDLIRLANLVLDCNNDASVVQKAAKFLHRDAKSCKLDELAKSHDGDSFFNMSHTQAASMIPCQIFNFAATLLSGKYLPLRHGGNVCCKDELEEKALNLPQHILYAICKLLGSAFDIYNETRSKNLITLLNHITKVSVMTPSCAIWHLFVSK